MPSEEQTYRAYVKEKLETIDSKVTYTNGKVRKLIIAMVLLAGIVIGLGFTEGKVLLPLLLP